MPTEMHLWWGPGTHWQTTLGNGSSLYTMNGSNDLAAWVYQVDRAGDIDQGSICVTSLLDTGGAVNWYIEIQGVTAATGEPDGVPISSSELVTLGTEITAGHTAVTVTFGTPATVAQGDLIALVMRPGPTPPNGTNFINVLLGRTVHSGTETFAFPMTMSSADTGATWTHSAAFPFGGVRFDDGSWIALPLDNQNLALTDMTAYNSGDSPNEYGARFQIPHAMTIIGVRFSFRLYGTIHPTVHLYDSDGSSELASAQLFNVGGGITNRIAYAIWGEVALAADTDYYIGMTNPSGATDISEAFRVDIFDAAHRGGVPFFDGLRWARASRTGAGAWTIETDVLPLMALAVSAVGA